MVLGGVGRPVRERCLVAIVFFAVAAPGLGQAPQATALHVHTLNYQSAAETVGIVHPLLSTVGSIELQPETNTLVIRDRPEPLRRVAEALAAWDHPPLDVELGLRLVRAAVGGGASAAPRPLPEPLVSRLRQLLRFESFEVLGEAEFSVREREAVAYRLGDQYEVSFRLGTLYRRSLKLHGFQVARGTPTEAPDRLIQTDLSVTDDRPMVLGLAASEASDRALMVIVSMQSPSQQRRAD
jgi:hypothetical protein